MSDNVLRIIPASEILVPSRDVAERAVNIVRRALPGADEVVAESYGQPTFIDQGANIEAVICPACGARVDLDDVSDWWDAISHRIGNEDLTKMTVTMCCCGREVPFSQLSFDWPAGIASFEISVRNPNVRDGLQGPTLGELERAIGCAVRQIWAHY